MRSAHSLDITNCSRIALALVVIAGGLAQWPPMGPALHLVLVAAASRSSTSKDFNYDHLLVHQFCRHPWLPADLKQTKLADFFIRPPNWPDLAGLDFCTVLVGGKVYIWCTGGSSGLENGENDYWQDLFTILDSFQPFQQVQVWVLSLCPTVGVQFMENNTIFSRLSLGLTDLTWALMVGMLGAGSWRSSGTQYASHYNQSKKHFSLTFASQPSFIFFLVGLQ